ncbi:MAG: hypothetical protein AAF192_06160, partial [Pseudomonadota bacterium]
MSDGPSMVREASGSRPCVVLRPFGGVSVRVDDGPALSLPGKQQALIAALALAPGMARSRSWLRSALWSDATPERAQSSLSTALAELRRALGEAADALQADRTQVRLHEPRVRILGDAADGPLLDGLDLRNADGFE